MKRVLSVLLSLTIMASVFVPFVSVYADDGVVVASPVTEKSEALESYTAKSGAKSSSITKSYGGHTYYTDGDELVSIVKKNLDARKESFTVYYISKSLILTSSQALKLALNLKTAATEDELSTSSTDGDYTRWAVYEYGISSMSRDTYSSPYYYYTVDLKYTYYDTAEEEKQVGSAINKFVDSLDTNSLSDYEIIKEIHDFVCSKTTYEYNATQVDKYKYAYSPYGALVKGKSVCQGYALAFYRICRELGYSARFLSSESHAWNIVELDGKYYYVDCTWDDVYLDEGKPGGAYTYFLVNNTNLCKNDEEAEHTLDWDYYTDYFITNYYSNITNKNYDKNAKNLLSNSIITLSDKSYSYTGSYFYPDVTVYDNNNTKLTQNTDFTVSYLNNKNAGVATVKVVGVGDYAGCKTQPTFRIYPDGMPALSLASGSRSASSVTLSWSKPKSNVTGYSVEQYKNEKWTVIKTTSSLSLKVSSLSSNTRYQFRIRAYKDSLYGPYSSVYTVYTKPAKPTLSLKTNSANSITLSWKKLSGNGYSIEQYKNNKWTVIKTVTSPSTVSYKVSKLTAGTEYKFRIRAYSTASGSKLYGEYATLNTCTKPKNATLSSISTKSKSITVKWKKLNCTGYQIQYSTNKNFKSGNKSQNITKSSTTSKKISSLKKDKMYYVRIRAYKTAGGKKYYSEWSNAKSIKCK